MENGDERAQVERLRRRVREAIPSAEQDAVEEITHHLLDRLARALQRVEAAAEFLHDRGGAVAEDHAGEAHDVALTPRDQDAGEQRARCAAVGNDAKNDLYRSAGACAGDAQHRRRTAG